MRRDSVLIALFYNILMEEQNNTIASVEAPVDAEKVQPVDRRPVFLRRDAQDHPVCPVDTGLHAAAGADALGQGGLFQRIAAHGMSLPRKQRSQPPSPRVTADHSEFHRHHLHAIVCRGRRKRACY